MRPAAFLLPADRLRFQAAVDALAPFLRPVRQAPSFGWRAHRRPPRPGRYRGQRSEWADCLRLLRAHADRFGHLVFLDIADFYASIRRDLLDRALRPARRGRGADLDALFEAFFSARLDHPGLPQNHQPSAVLANAYVDAALTGVEVPTGRAAVVRWMDDLWIFGATAAAAGRVRDQVAARLAAWNLRMNDAKTGVYQGSEVRAAVEGTTVRAPDRYEANQASLNCFQTDEEWNRISEFADPRAVDSLRARLLYAHPCADRLQHAGLAAELTTIVGDFGARPSRFQPAAWWLARWDPRGTREALTAALPRMSDPFLARAGTLAALDAGAEPREVLAARTPALDPLLARHIGAAGSETAHWSGFSASGQGVADAAQAAREYVPVAPVGHGLA